MLINQPLKHASHVDLAGRFHVLFSASVQNDPIINNGGVDPYLPLKNGLYCKSLLFRTTDQEDIFPHLGRVTLAYPRCHFTVVLRYFFDISLQDIIPGQVKQLLFQG